MILSKTKLWKLRFSWRNCENKVRGKKEVRDHYHKNKLYSCKYTNIQTPPEHVLWRYKLGIRSKFIKKLCKLCYYKRRCYKVFKNGDTFVIRKWRDFLWDRGVRIIKSDTKQLRKFDMVKMVVLGAGYLLIAIIEMHINTWQ